MTFRLAPMSRLILVLTSGLLVLPFVFLGSAAFVKSPLPVPGVLLLVVYAWVWLRFRPVASSYIQPSWK